MDDLDLNLSDLKSIFSLLLGRPVASVEPIGGGRNSRVYKLVGEDSGRFAAKLYFRHPLDERDRLGVEFSSLQFLREHGIQSIPRPILADQDRGCGIYEYIQGVGIRSSEVTDRDIDVCVEFLAKLNDLKSAQGSLDIPPASASCFSVKEIVDSVERRLKRLADTEADTCAAGEGLHPFLKTQFQPALQKIRAWCEKSHAPDVFFDRVIGMEERTLSPSDFGFHNVLRRPDGQLAFLDFEYFGWDDPAKMISDFLLHPGMDIPEYLKRRFVSGLFDSFAGMRHIAKRVEIVYPAVGLLWCMILLNEFVPEHLQRRAHARPGDVDRNRLQAEQLAKAGQMLQKIMRDYENFPYRA